MHHQVQTGTVRGRDRGNDCPINKKRESAAVMKLAEALVERRAAQDKINQLNERLQRVALVQEGETPAEIPTDLLMELRQVSDQLETLMVAINRTNLQATLADGRSITAAIAQRDVLRMRMGVIEALLRNVGSANQRMRGSEIKLIPTVHVASLQKERDALAQQYRNLDTAIQAVNWTVDLIQ